MTSSIPNAGFTPGPWRAFPQLDDDLRPETDDAKISWAYIGYNWDAHGSFAACLARIDRRKDASAECRARTMADARLLAAAPELYEALEIICREFAQGHPLIAAGRAALKQARGEQ